MTAGYSPPIQSYLETRFEALEANEFKPIAHSPCSMVPGTLRAYRALSKEDRLRYRKIASTIGAGSWTSEAMLTETERAWYGRFVQSCFPFEYPDESRELARAKDLRKVAKICFSQLLGATPKCLGGGDWLYEGRLNEWPVSVEIRYDCTLTQIEYGVHVKGMQGEHPHLSAERLYGLGLGYWNRIYLAEIDQCFALLSDFVTMVVEDHGAIVRLTNQK